MKYNTQRPQLSIPEYGRNVHNMVSFCMSIEDRERRNRVAQSIIDVMGNLNPHLRDVHDFKHKLWDHLFIMSNFKLDVDSPYPIPTPETFEERPNIIDYPKKGRTYRHYGKIVRDMVDYTVAHEEGEIKEGLKVAIANQMKKSYMLWNKDTVSDDVIIADLKALSGGAIDLPSDTELSNHNQYKGQTSHQHRSNRKGRSNKGRRKHKK